MRANNKQTKQIIIGYKSQARGHGGAGVRIFPNMEVINYLSEKTRRVNHMKSWGRGSLVMGNISVQGS